MMLLPPITEMYRALVERDASFEGLFYACVRTTGIFCRPTCHARKPKPENVEFAATIQDALHRGYRPCQLCEPMSVGTGAPNWLAPLLDEIRKQPALRLRDEDLRDRGLDPVQVRRTFKRTFGMTFQAYQRACRLGAAMKSLHGGAPTIDAGLDAGFESDSGFRDAFARVFGDTPARARGTALLTAAWIETPLGPMLAIAGDAGLELLEFVDRRALETELRELRRTLKAGIVPGEHPVLAQTHEELREYFAGARRAFGIPLKLQGSPFQLAAWRGLCEIPYGETRSYADMARRVGSPGAVRAIGRVNGQNRIAIVVPCHRVIRSDGSLCGYGGGRWRKQWLLDHEGSNR
ncbi:MAG TPA: trifunctional transcriptional activator/DNA repair protein Ada/methylated-DNA--[protein]-cysteine S-methyltransferase [Vicinamibacterales bacterium]|jgi:AraC family transcriptional regulator of adaptative response/methylated-DNA-[protein]-cysteine methyltransferase|nr:trifunctional transcriptional activator/DNA repair protein Ada/methylated-DNA--[protein]-cysteine S-methyltransferase [Vicinamibacterales bacterium]